MDFTTLIASISQVGFPVVCCYLLITRVINRLDNITDSINNLQKTIVYVNAERPVKRKRRYL